jgi:hypothetical protein
MLMPWDDPFARVAREPEGHGRKKRPRGSSAFAGVTLFERIQSKHSRGNERHFFCSTCCFFASTSCSFCGATHQVSTAGPPGG